MGEGERRGEWGGVKGWRGSGGKRFFNLSRQKAVKVVMFLDNRLCFAASVLVRVCGCVNVWDSFFCFTIVIVW